MSLSVVLEAIPLWTCIPLYIFYCIIRVRKITESCSIAVIYEWNVCNGNEVCMWRMEAAEVHLHLVVMRSRGSFIASVGSSSNAMRLLIDVFTQLQRAKRRMWKHVHFTLFRKLNPWWIIHFFSFCSIIGTYGNASIHPTKPNKQNHEMKLIKIYDRESKLQRLVDVFDIQSSWDFYTFYQIRNKLFGIFRKIKSAILKKPFDLLWLFLFLLLLFYLY